MNLDFVDQRTRDDIAASAAAHSELGRDYDGAVAQGLIARAGPAARTGTASVALPLGSMGMGVLAALAVMKRGGLGPANGGGQLFLVAVIWIIIGIINVVYARRN